MSYTFKLDGVKLKYDTNNVFFISTKNNNKINVTEYNFVVLAINPKNTRLLYIDNKYNLKRIVNNFYYMKYNITVQRLLVPFVIQRV